MEIPMPLKNYSIKVPPTFLHLSNVNNNKSWTTNTEVTRQQVIEALQNFINFTNNYIITKTEELNNLSQTDLQGREFKRMSIKYDEDMLIKANDSLNSLKNDPTWSAIGLGLSKKKSFIKNGIKYTRTIQLNKNKKECVKFEGKLILLSKLKIV